MAIDRAREGLARGQSPFGCAIARDDEVVAACHNRVYLATDITAHAEVTALREACTHTGCITLEGAIVATTCEPCPMCMSALHWARVDTVYFGATIADAQDAGFNELTIPARSVLELGGSEVKLIGGVMEAECRALFAEWKSNAEAQAY
jgi:tRNA(Arg) A34 adenosine deaminase TadA